MDIGKAFAAVFALSLAAHGAERFVLVSESGCATVALPKMAEGSSRLAAQEFTNYVHRLTGRSLPVVFGDVPRTAKCVVRIGTLATIGDVPKAAADALRSARTKEASWQAVDGNTLWFIGREDVAELHSVYRFLQEELGVRWFKAATDDDPGDYVPPRRDVIALEPFVRVKEPSMPERRVDMCCAATQFPAPRSQECFLRNGYQIHTTRAWYPKDRCEYPAIAEYYAPRVPRRRISHGGGHLIFVNVWPPDERHFREHPEYFALVDGKRTMGKQYCYSNTNLLAIAADAAIARFDEYGGLGEYDFALWDSMQGACECDRCVAMATPEETKRGIESTRFHKFVNFMAERIYARWPNAYLNYLAYWTYRQPPADVPHDPRMPVHLCLHERCYGHDFMDPGCARNARRLAEAREWLRIAPYVYTYEYFSATPCNYLPNELTMARDLKAYHALGMKGWKEEAEFSDSHFVARDAAELMRLRDSMTSCWQRFYVCGRLSWDITLDENALLEDAESKYYGSAYPAMRKYHELRRRLWHANRNCLGYSTGDQRTPTLLNTAGAREELTGYLDDAARLASGDRIAAGRVALDRRWLEEYWIKPNDRLRKFSGKTIAAVRATTPIAIDGVGDEGAWIGAHYSCDLIKRVNFSNRKESPIPVELSTSVGVCQDGSNLYFLVSAKEPQIGKMKMEGFRDGPVWGDDGIELFLYPPSLDNRYYHIAVNPRGDVYDAQCPGNEAGWDLGVEAKARVLSDRYVIEVKVPAERMHPLVDGETWRFNFARNRNVQDSITPKGDCWSLGGAGHHDTLAYRSMTIGGESLLRNGSFDALDANGAPKNWTFAHGRGSVAEERGNRFARIDGDVLYQYVTRAGAKRIAYSFRARGKGRLKTFFYSFTDTPNARAKHGYDRRFNPSLPGGKFALAEGWQNYSATFTVPENETCGLAFTPVDGAEGVCVDDVSVTSMKD